MNLYKRIVNGICACFEYFAVLCLGAMVVVVVVQVTGRYVFRNTPAWSEELARQFMIIFSFIGIAVGVREKRHIALTVVADTFMRKIWLPIEIAGKFLVMIMGAMMSLNMWLLFSNLRYNRLPGTGIPVLWIYAFPTAIGLLVAAIAFYQIYDHFRFGTDERQRELKGTEARNDG